MRKQPVPVEVENYFDDLDPAARAVLYPVIDAVRDAMPSGYELGLQFGMPGWVVPLSRYPDTFNGRPLSYVSVGAQKNHHSLYLRGLANDPARDAAFRAEWVATGRTLDMGTSCLRFRTFADVDLDLVVRAVADMPVGEFLAAYERSTRAN